MQQRKIQFRALELCSMCNQQFERNHNKEPRILRCGHDICSNCVKNAVLQKGFLTCPICGQQYSKIVCSTLKINHFYLDMIQNIESTFGKFYVFQQKKHPQTYQKQVNILIRKTNNTFQHYLRENDMSQQFVKCKNSPCFKMTDLIFCSEDCQLQFEEVETKKNQSNNLKGRKSNESIIQI